MKAWQRFDDIGRMDERAKYPTPGPPRRPDRVCDGRHAMLQEDGARLCEYFGAVLSVRRSFEQPERLGDHVL